MVMNEAIIKLHRAKLVPAVSSFIFGIALIIARKSAMDVAIKIAAAMLMIGSVGCLLMYFFGPVNHESPQLGIGIAMACVGVLVWFISETLVDLFPGIAGITLLLNGMSNLFILRSPEEQTQNWVVILISAVMVVGGFLILLQPAAIADALMIYIGVSYVLNGILDLLLMHLAKDALLKSFPPQE